MRIAKNDNGQFVLVPDNADDGAALEHLYQKGVMGRIKDVASISHNSERIELKIIGHEVDVLEKDLARLRGESGSCEHRMGRPVWDVDNGVVKNARLICPDCGKANNDVLVSVVLDDKNDGSVSPSDLLRDVIKRSREDILTKIERALKQHLDDHHNGLPENNFIAVRERGGLEGYHCNECDMLMFNVDWEVKTELKGKSDED